MTYSAVVMWIWVVALGATAVGSVVAVRALSRADAAVAGLRAAATDLVITVPGAQAHLDRAVGEAALRRDQLDARAALHR